MAMIMGCSDNINSEDYADRAAFHAAVSAKVEKVHGEPWVYGTANKLNKYEAI